MANESETWNGAEVYPDVKVVLEREFGVTTEALIDKLKTYEDRRDDRVECGDMSIAREDIERLRKILFADGVLASESASDDEVIAKLADWTGEMIIKTYAEYEAEGRFATGEEEL